MPLHTKATPDYWENLPQGSFPPGTPTTLQGAITASDTLTTDNEIKLNETYLDIIAGTPDYTGATSNILIQTDNIILNVQDVTTLILETLLITPTRFLINGENTTKQLEINKTTNKYQLGDIDENINGWKIEINDGSQQANLGSTSGTELHIGDNDDLIWFKQAGTTRLELDELAKTYKLGDVNNIENGTKIIIDDNSGGSKSLRVEAVNGIKITGDTVLIHTGTNYGNGAAAQVGTLTNAPAPGNPTKWIPIDDNGTTRYIPSW